MSQAIQNDSNVSSQDNPNWVQVASCSGESTLSVGDFVTLAVKNSNVSTFFKTGAPLYMISVSDSGESLFGTVGSFGPGEKARIISIWKHTLGMTSALIEKENGTVGQIPFHFLAPAQ